MKLDIIEIAKKNTKKIIIEITLLLCLSIFWFCSINLFTSLDNYSFCFGIIALFLFGSIIENYREIRKLREVSIHIEYQKCGKIIIYKRNNFLLLDEYIVDLEGKPIFYNYNDIIMLFHQKEISGGFCRSISEYLYLYLKFSKRIKLLVSSNYPNDKITSERIISIIKEKNPNVLVGKTKENKQILLEKYGIKL